MYSVTQLPLPRDFPTFFPKRLGIFSPNLTRLIYFLSMRDYKFLSNYRNFHEVMTFYVRSPNVLFHQW